MAHIIFIAKGTGGDLVPFPKIGQELKKHGHRITLLSHCSYEGLARQNGWDFAALDTPEQRQQIIDDGQLLNSPSGYPTYFRRHVFPRVAAEYEAIRERYIPGETVLVTTHKACLTPLLAAEKLGIPLVRLFATVSELITLPLMEGMYQAVLAEDLDGARTAIGLPPVEKGSAWLRKADRELALWPDWFAAPDNDWVVPALPVGFIQEMGEEINPGLLETLKSAEPPILVTAGTGLFTDPRFYTASAEACRQLNRRGILVTRYPQLVPSNLPEQVQHYEYLPFASLMPHVAGVIHHGGVGSLACALAAGVPQLVLAAGGDRPENGERIQRLGVGEFLLPPRWEPGSIASALKRLLNSPSVRENCREFALRLRASDAAAEACKWIESAFLTPSAALAPSPKATAAELMRNLSPEKQALLARRLKEKRGLNHGSLPAAAEQGMVTGPMPVMPMLMLDYVYRPPQAWWRAFEMLVEIPRILRPAQLMQAMQHLIIHHDGLRLRLVKENADYRMFIAESEHGAFEQRDLSGLPASEQDGVIEAAREELWDSLNFSSGPLFRIVFFDLGLERLPRLLIVLHHFAVDAYSVGILLNDFQAACRQILMGEALKLPTKTTSIKAWAERMDAYVHSEAVKPEVAYWKSLPWDRLRPTPVDHPQVSQSPYASLMGSLDADETQALLNKVPAAYQVRLWDVLITACVLTYARYAQLQPLLILVLHHGRNLTFDDLDLSQTVGNLYTSYPLLLDIDLDLSLKTPEKVLKLVADERMRVPHGGAAWHWVSYHSTEKFISLQENMKITPNVVFNYLGEMKPDTQSEMFSEIRKPTDSAVTHLYDVTGKSPHTCETVIEAGRFKVNWEYFSALDERATIERLVQEYLSILRSLISACCI